MLKRILASLAVTSLLIFAVLLVYWWRSRHGYTDSLTLGRMGSTQSIFTSSNGRVGLEVIDHQGAIVTSRMQFYEFRTFLGYFLLVPALWLAVKVRSWLPRPPGQPPRARTTKFESKIRDT